MKKNYNLILFQQDLCLKKGMIVSMEDCIFCKIINKEIPGSIVYENDNVLAFKDINPQAPIHIILVPKKHVTSIMEADSEISANITHAIKEIAKEQKIDKLGFRVITNCGKDAGQTVNHLHFHILAGTALGEKIL